MEEKTKRIGKDKATSTGGGRGGGEGREGKVENIEPSGNNSSQLREGQKTMGLLTRDWRSWEGYGMLKSYESMVENHWEFCRMINHIVYDYVTLDIELRLLHNG